MGSEADRCLLQALEVFVGKSVAAKSKTVICIPEQHGKTRERQMADTMLSSALQSAMVIEGFGKNVLGELGIAELYDSLKDKGDTLRSGNLIAVELMLFNQAQALQGIFTSLARRAALNAGEYLNATDTYLRLALKAQAQCRATLETLAEIKNPQPTAFIRQQNIAANQQVNNGTAPPAASPGANARVRAEDSDNPANKLSAVTYEQGQQLDFPTSTAASGSHPAMATLDAGHRA
ncbi:hypothetical protein [Nevskia ramosa]|uniref:hypothetical protein n=1 Tax=Nevskia ramosa TaxID=64002 RepID=UPI00235656F1|nr:hypothetical protein [Nevskia ramosa]